MSDEDDVLAAELALGLEAGSAIRVRMTSDSAFAQRVTWWEQQLAGLAADLGQDPADDLWPRIAAALPQNDNGRGVLRWKVFTLPIALVPRKIGMFGAGDRGVLSVKMAGILLG